MPIKRDNQLNFTPEFYTHQIHIIEDFTSKPVHDKVNAWLRRKALVIDVQKVDVIFANNRFVATIHYIEKN